MINFFKKKKFLEIFDLKKIDKNTLQIEKKNKKGNKVFLHLWNIEDVEKLNKIKIK
jgi:ribosomal 30S subunit maturation factor RimM